MRPGRGILALAVVTAWMALPATAGATTYCVDDNPCQLAGGILENTLGEALIDAGNHSGADRIEIGSATEDENAGGGDFLYSSPDPLDIVGAGQSATTLLDNAA